MEQAGWHRTPLRSHWRRWSMPILLGLPLITGALWLTQANPRSQLDSFLHQQFSSLQPPYRYSFYDSLPTERSPAAAAQQEIGFYQQKVQEQPQNGLNDADLAAAYLRMARATGEGSWYLLAEQAAQKSLAKLPVDNTSAIAVLARVAEARHDFAGALALVNKIADSRDALSVQTTANLAMGRLAAANQAATALVDRTLSMNAFTLQAMVETAQGQDAAALRSFQHALQVEEAGEFSSSARVRTLLGRFYYEQGQLKQARELYQEALAINPHYPQALLNLAQLNIREGNLDAAWQHYEQIPSNTDIPTVYEPLILRGKARIQSLRGDRTRAEQLWQQAEDLLRQSFAGTGALTFGHRRDLALILLERGNPADAAEAVILMQTETKLRRDADTLEIHAWALMQQGRLSEAERVIQSALSTGTRDAVVLERAAAIAQVKGETAAAKRLTQQIKAVDPTFGNTAKQAARLGSGLGI